MSTDTANNTNLTEEIEMASSKTGLNKSVKFVSLDKLQLNPNNPRYLSAETIQAMARDLKTVHGIGTIMIPLIVLPPDSEGNQITIDGNRRLSGMQYLKDAGETVNEQVPTITVSAEEASNKKFLDLLIYNLGISNSKLSHFEEAQSLYNIGEESYKGFLADGQKENKAKSGTLNYLEELSGKSRGYINDLWRFFTSAPEFIRVFGLQGKIDSIHNAINVQRESSNLNDAYGEVAPSLEEFFNACLDTAYEENLPAINKSVIDKTVSKFTASLKEAKDQEKIAAKVEKLQEMEAPQEIIDSLQSGKITVKDVETLESEAVKSDVPLSTLFDELVETVEETGGTEATPEDVTHSVKKSKAKKLQLEDLSDLSDDMIKTEISSHLETLNSLPVEVFDREGLMQLLLNMRKMSKLASGISENVNKRLTGSTGNPDKEAEKARKAQEKLEAKERKAQEREAIKAAKKEAALIAKQEAKAALELRTQQLLAEKLAKQGIELPTTQETASEASENVENVEMEEVTV